MILNWIEIKKFLKNNIFKILTGSIIISIPLYIFMNTSSVFDNVNTSSMDEETESGKDLITELPATFLFYIENEDGSPFTNNRIIQEYLVKEENLLIASVHTETDLYNKYMTTDNEISVNYSVSGIAKVLEVIIHNDSNLHEFYVNVGSELENLKLATYFYNLIIEDSIPFLENKKIYTFSEPRLKDLEIVQNETQFSNVDINEGNNKIWIRHIIISVLIALLTTTVFLFISKFFSKKLKYSFSYSLDEDDNFILIDSSLENQNELLNLMTTPHELRKILLVDNIEEFNDMEEIMNTSADNSNLEIANSVLEINNLIEVDRVIFLIQEGKTNRIWYNKQRGLLESINNQKIIIQKNREKNN